jgi:hypothetical protein
VLKHADGAKILHADFPYHRDDGGAIIFPLLFSAIPTQTTLVDEPMPTTKPLHNLPKAPDGVRTEDRTGPGGSNTNLQQDLYRTMHHLSRLTGDPRYSAAAHAALVDFLRITQNPDTGLLAWGEHLYWNCFDDCLGDSTGNGESIHTWSQAYGKTKDPYFDHAVRVLATRHLNKLTERHDRGFLGLPHSPNDPKRGYVFFAYTDSGKVRPDVKKQTDGYSRHWAMGYGVHTTSMFATLSYTRQAQLSAGETGDAYRKLVVQAADLYCNVEPDAKKPGHLGLRIRAGNLHGTGGLSADKRRSLSGRRIPG